MDKENRYVICGICGKRIIGKAPKGGDGSLLYPRKHYTWYNYQKVICHGSYHPTKEEKDL